MAQTLDKKLKRCQDPASHKPVWEVVNVENIVSPGLLQGFVSTAKELSHMEDAAEHLAPTVAFHGTWERNNINSIVEEGFLQAGDVTGKGQLVPMASGAMWGQGIYVSPSFAKAAQYACFDSRGHAVMFVSLLLPGRCHRYTQREVDEVYRQMAKNPSFCGDWWHKDGMHTHCTVDAEEMIVYENQLLLPVFLLTFSLRGCAAPPTLVPTAMAKLNAAVSSPASYDKLKKRKRRKRMEALKVDAEDSSRADRKSFTFHQLPMGPGKDEMWVGSLTPITLEHVTGSPPAETRSHMVFLLDKSNSMGANFRKLLLPACAQLYTRLQPASCSVVMFGKTVTTYSSKQVTSAAFFESPAATKTVLEGATDLLGGIKAGVNLALKDKVKREEAWQEELLARAMLWLDADFAALAEEAKKGTAREDMTNEAASKDRSVVGGGDGDLGAAGEDGPSDQGGEGRPPDGSTRCGPDGFTVADTEQASPVRGGEGEQPVVEPRQDPPVRQDDSEANEPLESLTTEARIEMDARGAEVAAAATSVADGGSRASQQVRLTKRQEKRAEKVKLMPQQLQQAQATARASAQATALEAKAGFMTGTSASRQGKLPADRKEDLTPAQLEAELKKRVQILRNSCAQQDLYVFILMTDGEDTVNSPQTRDDELAALQRDLSGSGMQSICKVVAIGREVDTSFTMAAKLATQTLAAWEQTPCHYARRVRMLPKVVQDLSSDLQLAANGWSVHLQVPEYLSVVQHGFVSSLTLPPSGSTSAVLGDRDQVAVLFRGRPPTELVVYAGGAYPAVVEVHLDTHPRMRTIASQSLALGLLTSLVADVKMCAVAGRRNVQPCVDELSALVSGIKHLNLQLKDLRDVTPASRVAQMKSKRRLVTQLEQLVNDLKDNVALALSKMNADQQAMWLNQANKLKYGVKTLRRAEAVTAGEVGRDLVSLADDEAYWGASDCGPVQSESSGRNMVGHLREIGLHPVDTSSSVVQHLYAYGAVGIGIRVRAVESAVVNPWNVTVEYVSTAYVDTATAMCALHAGVPLRDGHGREFHDVLVLCDPRCPAPYQAWLKSKLAAAYGAVIFARNPDLVLPAQRVALLTVSLVTAITQLMSAAHRGPALVERIYHIIASLRGIVSNREDWKAIFGKLVQPQPGRCMTEAEPENVISVCFILGALCCFPERVNAAGLFQPENRTVLGEVALALMGECVSRCARVQVKAEAEKLRARAKGGEVVSDAQASHKLTCRALHITEETCEVPAAADLVSGQYERPTGEFDRDTARVKSGNFFARSWTNASPQAVVACLAFAEALAMGPHADGLDEFLASHGFEPPEEDREFCRVAEVFETVKMRTFIDSHAGAVFGASHVGRESALDLQIALYVQGLQYYNSKSRRHGLPPLSAPLNVIQDAAVSARLTIYHQRLRQELNALREGRLHAEKGQRLSRQREEQLLFLQEHDGLPTVFTETEVKVLNEQRPPDDQIVLSTSGLPLHHCSFPRCSEYLTNMSTEQDRVLGKRTGFYKHIRRMFYPRQLYVPRMHLVALFNARKYRDEATFVARCLQDLFQGEKGDPRFEATKQDLPALFATFRRIL